MKAYWKASCPEASEAEVGTGYAGIKPLLLLLFWLKFCIGISSSYYFQVLEESPLRYMACIKQKNEQYSKGLLQPGRAEGYCEKNCYLF